MANDRKHLKSLDKCWQNTNYSTLTLDHNINDSCTTCARSEYLPHVHTSALLVLALLKITFQAPAQSLLTGAY